MIDRDISSLILNVSTEQIPELKAAINAFRRKFNADTTNYNLKNPNKVNEVYALCIQFFRVTEKDVTPA